MYRFEVLPRLRPRLLLLHLRFPQLSPILPIDSTLDWQHSGCVPRIVCHFSCGAASAVATKLALADYGQENVVILNAFLVEEHSDNRRFAADCERWFEHPITVLRNEKYGSSVREVWRKERFIKNALMGASCSRALKHDLLAEAALPDDVHIMGYTSEEYQRWGRFLERRPTLSARAPLIDRNLNKADCLGIIERAGIELPWSYRNGFNNANCIGCCHGGMGYWNLVRIKSPEAFKETALIQDELGPGSYFWRGASGERISLRMLDPNAGRNDTTTPDCSLFCAMAEQEL